MYRKIFQKKKTQSFEKCTGELKKSKILKHVHANF